MTSEPFVTGPDSPDELGPGRAPDSVPHTVLDEVDVRETAQLEDVPPTGEPRVDDAVAILATLDDLPTAAHADVYEDVHRRLHSALTELDTD
jgi:hypothetical protein